MEECCNTCVHRLILEKWDYSHLSSDNWKEPQKGYVCDLFANEGIAVWMVGNDGKGQCECWEKKND